jgi:hypothetical protein
LNFTLYNQRKGSEPSAVSTRLHITDPNHSILGNVLVVYFWAAQLQAKLNGQCHDNFYSLFSSNSPPTLPFRIWLRIRRENRDNRLQSSHWDCVIVSRCFNWDRGNLFDRGTLCENDNWLFHSI